MKKYMLLACLFLQSLALISQITPSSQWKWVTGDNVVQSVGSYGTIGIASPSNTPGARDGAITWKDASGNFWLFGGFGYGESVAGSLNDLWKFDPVSQQWTWINGDKIPEQFGVYGTQGVASPSNKPGGRTGSASWVDLTGNFWLFGGSGLAAASGGILNDLWKYDPLTNQWTWVKGDNTNSVAGVYGTKGVAAAANKPGTRFASVSWIDNSGNLWLFGGRGYANTAPGSFGNLNDLWKYDLLTNQWTWMSGDNTTNSPTTYGTQGVPSASNQPGGRYESASWKDASGNFWFLGGETYFPISLVMNSYNELWKYDLTTNQWTWMKGNNTPNVNPTWGTQGVADPANDPGARYGSVTWVDALGKFWLFAGQFNFFNGVGGSGGNFNDLWKFDPVTNQWTWVKGDNNMAQNHGIYGTKNVASPANKPGSRWNHVSWIDASGNLWIFGGYAVPAAGSLDRVNDLWKLNIAGVVPVILLNISAQPVQNKINVTWQTSQEINSSHFIIERSADGILFSGIGNVTAAGNSSSLKNYSFIDQQPLDGINYYRVKMIDKDGASKYSAVVKIVMTSKNSITISPNPVTHIATIHLATAGSMKLAIKIYDAVGRIVINREIILTAGSNSIPIDMSDLPNGVYTAMIKTETINQNFQIVKQ